MLMVPHLADFLYFLVFLVEMEFCYVAQAGLELLDLSNPPATASQNVWITGVNYWPIFIFIFEMDTHSATQAGVQ